MNSKVKFLELKSENVKAMRKYAHSYNCLVVKECGKEDIIELKYKDLKNLVDMDILSQEFYKKGILMPPY